MLCTKGVNMVKEIQMDPDDIIEYVRNNVKDEIIEFRHMPGGDEDKLIIVEASL